MSATMTRMQPVRYRYGDGTVEFHDTRKQDTTCSPSDCNARVLVVKIALSPDLAQLTTLASVPTDDTQTQIWPSSSDERGPIL